MLSVRSRRRLLSISAPSTSGCPLPGAYPPFVATSTSLGIGESAAPINVLWRVGQPVRPKSDPDHLDIAEPQLLGFSRPHGAPRLVRRRCDTTTIATNSTVAHLARTAIGCTDDRRSRRPTRSRGLVLLLPDRLEHEAMSLKVAERLGRRPRASTASITAGRPRRLR